MSATCSSPSCESRSRDTASYSYRPCCALVVDLMCHCKSGRDSARATSSASMVLPVPGSPLTRSGLSSVIAALTASIKSGVAMYVSVPSKRMAFAQLPKESMLAEIRWLACGAIVDRKLTLSSQEPLREPQRHHPSQHGRAGALRPPCDQSRERRGDEFRIRVGEGELSRRDENDRRD